ncbi:RibD family protein [Macromonas bipunctata]|uniref:RibD family protein n=1 Tax=Macromonas bipunctata TaxID=183670 RepID=UPI000C34BD2A|nr:dihydrofolate reductase family protein [Macromonas bipunctata]
MNKLLSGAVLGLGTVVATGTAWAQEAAATATAAPAAHSPRREALAVAGALVLDTPATTPSPSAHAQVDLPTVLRDLARRGVNELHLEAGARLSGAWLQAGLVNELLLYLAPQLLGPGTGLAQIGPFTALAQGVALQFAEATPVGPDLRIRARCMPNTSASGH